MPISFEFDKENNILYEFGTGPLCVDDFIQHRQTISKLALKSGLKCLCNYSGAEIDMHFNDMQQISLSVIRSTEMVQIDNIQIAIITDNDLGYGLARICEAMTSDEKHDVQVFRSIENAKTWLDI